MTDLSVKHVHVLDVGIWVNSARVRLKKAEGKVIGSTGIASVCKIGVRVDGKGRTRGIVKRQQPLQNGVVFRVKPPCRGRLGIFKNRHGVHRRHLYLPTQRSRVEGILDILYRRQHLVHQVRVVWCYYLVSDGYEDDVAGGVERSDVGVHPRFRDVRVGG